MGSIPTPGTCFKGTDFPFKGTELQFKYFDEIAPFHWDKSKIDFLVKGVWEKKMDKNTLTPIDDGPKGTQDYYAEEKPIYKQTSTVMDKTKVTYNTKGEIELSQNGKTVVSSVRELTDIVQLSYQLLDNEAMVKARKKKCQEARLNALKKELNYLEGKK